MIVSEQYKFLFFELPRTGTTSIGEKLVTAGVGVKYDGYRHISISKFYRKNRKKYSDYKIVACIRNPMDRVLSLYLKMQRDHNGYFSKLESRSDKSFAQKVAIKRYRDIQVNNLSFEQYFLKYFKFPYVDWMYYDSKYCNQILRFESLQEDFNKVLSDLGVEIDSALPTSNVLTGKPKYLTYYTDRIQGRAQYVFGIYLKKNGYSFPATWKEYTPGMSSKLLFHITNILYRFVNICLK